MHISYRIYHSVHFQFETLLPYSIDLETGKAYSAVYDGLNVELLHLDRIENPRTSGARMSPHLAFPADKYGLFFRSRVALILPESSVRILMNKESDELRRTFPTPEEYVSHLFGTQAANLTSSIIGTLNKILSIYRVIYEDWHAAPIASMDLPSWRVLKLERGQKRTLTTLDLPHQCANGSRARDAERGEFFVNSLRAGATARPLPTLEADIHDRVSHGDLLVALVLMGLLVEEGIRDHLTKYMCLRDGITEQQAEVRLSTSNGIAYSIADMVDPPGGRRKSCLIEDIAAWQPYKHKQFEEWKTSVRELRNEIMHRGRHAISPLEAENAWTASVRFIELSFSQFARKLAEHGVELDAQLTMFRIRSSVAGTQGLVGAFNRI